MKKYLLSYFILTVLISCILIFFSDYRKDNEREAYNNYINNVGKKFCLSVDSLGVKQFDDPQGAAFQNYLMTMDPELKCVPVERLVDAFKTVKNSVLKEENIVWENSNVTMGGRTRCLLYDLNDLSGCKVWAGSVTGGLWYNNNITDEYSSWNVVDDFWQSLSVSRIVYDPNDIQKLYVSTGEAETAVVTYRESSGRGIFTSGDGGETWELLNSTSSFAYVTDIALRDEEGTSVIYAAVVSGVYQGVVHQSEPNDGLYRSQDNGLTWDQVLPNIPGEDIPYSPSDIEIGADGRIYVGTIPNINDAGGATILYSDSGTNGSWSVFDDYVSAIQSDQTYNIPGRVKLASSASNENVIYAFLAAGSDTQTIQTFRTYRCTYILRSDNKGSTWEEKNHPGGSNDWAYLAWHALAAKVDPNDENTIFAGGLDLHKSTDGGNSWNHISDWAAMYSGGSDDYVHADQHEIVFNPVSSSEIIFGTDGGVFYTNTGDQDYPVFRERSLNYNTLQFYTCAVHPIEGSDEIIGGLQDNGTVVDYGDFIDVEDMIDGGDGAYCFYDIDQPNIAITSAYNNSYTFFDNYNYVDFLSANSGTFTSPADYDYRINTIFANAGTFNGYYTNQLEKISGIPDNPTEDMVFLNTDISVPFSCVHFSKYSPANSTTLFVGSMSGQLFKVTNANTSPLTSEITGGNFPIAAVSSISLGTNENNIVVTFSNYGVESVFLSDNGGMTWECKEGNLPDIPVRWSIFHPQNNKQVMLATELGVWVTDDITDENVTWAQSYNGMPNVRVDMLRIRDNDNRVVAATHGRGFFKATFENIYTSVEDNPAENNFNVYPNPTDNIFTIELNISGEFKWELTSSNGRLIKKGLLSTKAKTISVSGLKSGIYFVSVLNGKHRSTKKIYVN